MIRESEGNLLDANTEAIVNTVNTVGVMGKGIALQFKQAFPENYKAYKAACDAGDVRIGEMFVFDAHTLGPRRYIINFPTKQHWRAKSKLPDIKSGLEALVDVVQKLHIGSIAIPALGCGNGGLEWSEVRPLIYEAFDRIPDLRVTLFPPTGAPQPESMPVATQAPNMTKGRSALVALIHGYVEQAKSERFEASEGASLLEIQKLMYLLQAVGQPMRLSYAKGSYGPYAENLNFQLQRMEGHLIRGYGDRSQRVLDFHPIKLIPGAVDAAEWWINANDDGSLNDAVSKVLKLIDGFASPYGLELLCTTHWASQHLEESAEFTSAVEAVQAWSRRKAEIFTKHHIDVACKQLEANGLGAA
ncbi:type II toxin-antitoxin system antitoxin DNA ADP-ribosyl glycohydrolase DarG [Streptomyces sp. bgisy027]|uniref:type II toxin-antitoxin system antitoxin DNA ADP-ribosyl glycohydrolase DarG n=1 Tax=Streptomyces sp. bgisy027 TaxID=3413770 RepID=UPI003D75862E